MARREDYPGDLMQFESRFASEKGCRDYLVELRWPDGFRCPRCDSPRGWATGRGFFVECAGCHYQASPTVGTIFERTRLPLKVWFRAMWLVTNQKNGMSAVSLQQQLGLRNYETAWTLLHKLRRAMVRPRRDRLAGVVEVDETYIGGEEKGVRGRGSVTKSLVAIAAQEDGKRVGRIRLEPIPDASGIPLLAFVERSVEPGSVVRTDGWKGYRGLSSRGYEHEVVKIKGSGMLGHELLPRVHIVAALVKRWLLGTHQGAVRPLHLDYYLDEFTFRFNRRRSRQRGKLFYRLVQQAVQVEPVTWQDVADGERGGSHKM